MTDENDATRRKKIARWTGDHLYEPVRKPDVGGRHAPRLPKFVPSLALLLIVGLLGTWFIFAGLARLRGSAVGWIWPDVGSLSADGALFDVTRSTATLAALVGGLFAAVYAYRKQRVDEAAGRRADDEALSKRYQDAAEQLGHQQAAVRLAGIYAMARLADDWEEQRRTCVEVLCSYARMPIIVINGRTELDLAEVQVRKSLFEVFSKHLHRFATPSWSDMSFNFDDSLLPGVMLKGAVFNTKPSFLRTTFTASNHFEGVSFNRGASFQQCRIEKGALHIEDFSCSQPVEIDFISIDDGASFSLRPQNLSLSLGGELVITAPNVRGVLSCYLQEAPVAQGDIRISHARVEATGMAGIRWFGADDFKSTVDRAVPHMSSCQAKGWRVLEGGRVYLGQSLIDLGVLNWEDPNIDPKGAVNYIDRSQQLGSDR